MGMDKKTSRSQQEANTSTTSNSTTTVRDIGFTGAQGVAIVRALGNIVNNGGANALQAQLAGFTFSQHAISDTLDFERQSIQTLSNLTQDVSQRTIAAGIGQATPLTQIAPAGSDKTGLLIAVAGIGLAVLALKD